LNQESGSEFLVETIDVGSLSVEVGHINVSLFIGGKEHHGDLSDRDSDSLRQDSVDVGSIVIERQDETSCQLSGVVDKVDVVHVVRGLGSKGNQEVGIDNVLSEGNPSDSWSSWGGSGDDEDKSSSIGSPVNGEGGQRVDGCERISNRLGSWHGQESSLELELVGRSDIQKVLELGKTVVIVREESQLRRRQAGKAGDDLGGEEVLDGNVIRTITGLLEEEGNIPVVAGVTNVDLNVDWDSGVSNTVSEEDLSLRGSDGPSEGGRHNSGGVVFERESPVAASRSSGTSGVSQHTLVGVETPTTGGNSGTSLTGRDGSTGSA